VQRLEINLAVKFCGNRVAVTKHLANLGQRCAPLKQVRCKRVSQDVSAFAWRLKSDAIHRLLHNG
jgi:hypothetical protein